MHNIIIYLFTIFAIIPLFGCRNYQKESNLVDNKSYINNFELLQENTYNKTSVKITSPKAIFDPENNDIEIFDSSIEIIDSNGKELKVRSGKSTLNNFKNLIRVYNNVNISFINKQKDSFIKTNSFDWDLKTSNLNLNKPLYITFDNTNIYSSSGFYNIDLGQLKIKNNILNRNIFNKDGEPIYQIKIIADIAMWSKDNNTLEFVSNEKQVETILKFLSIE